MPGSPKKSQWSHIGAPKVLGRLRMVTAYLMQVGAEGMGLFYQRGGRGRKEVRQMDVGKLLDRDLSLGGT